MHQIPLTNLATHLGQALSTYRWKSSTAESCTGGWVAETITSIAGSSAWFDRGFVTYSNEAKQDMLGVKKQTLDTHGAVRPTLEARNDTELRSLRPWHNHVCDQPVRPNLIFFSAGCHRGVRAGESGSAAACLYWSL